MPPVFRETRYYMYLPLPLVLHRKVVAIQRQHMPLQRCEPHVTFVVPSILWRGASEEDIFEALESIFYGANIKIREFLIESDGVGYFGTPEAKSVIFLGIKRNAIFDLYHDLITRALSEVLRPIDPTFAKIPQPHISLASDFLPKRRKQAEILWQQVREKTFFSQFVCNRINLLKRGPQDKWAVLKSYKLVA